MLRSFHGYPVGEEEAMLTWKKIMTGELPDLIYRECNFWKEGERQDDEMGRRN
jgi:hypothetical protein